MKQSVACGSFSKRPAPPDTIITSGLAHIGSQKMPSVSLLLFLRIARFEIQARKMLKEKLEGERPSTNSPRDTSRGLTILIADPQVTADVALVRCLVCEGHHVLIARNFESAYRFSKFDHLDYAVTELRFSDGKKM